MSSKPPTLTSSGTRSPYTRAASMTPSAASSLAEKTAVGGSSVTDAAVGSGEQYGAP
ncbi:hypothetical protein [Streptomyces sp. NPDC050164]|uniref:hypothetical protein n=1 Tax=Streptomyces sp. NPDC050164 TaxID=3365605 RepID=UPI0037978F69